VTLVEPHVLARMGDGSLVESTRSQIRADLEEGTQAAAARGKMAPLAADELDHLLGIYASSARFTGVDIGDEVVLSKDGSGTPQLGSRIDALYACEQVLAHDTVELFHIDYSYKAVKTVVPFEQQFMKEAQERLTVRVH
jgi:dimethylamine--corrinoid protein Co-methyltransferase